MKNYSQNNEQDFILKLFGDFVGSFLDIGANDGETLSNTYALSQLGWAGTCIEASPAAYERLVKTHEGNNNLVLLNFAVGSYDGEIVLHESGELLGTGDIALVSSTRQDETERWSSLNMPFKDVKVPVFTFTSAMGRTPQKTFEFVSVDIEGMEVEVIPQIDFAALGTKMCIIEWNGANAELFDGHMAKFGFTLIHTNAENRLYTL